MGQQGPSMGVQSMSTQLLLALQAKRLAAQTPPSSPPQSAQQSSPKTAQQSPKGLEASTVSFNIDDDDVPDPDTNRTKWIDKYISEYPENWTTITDQNIKDYLKSVKYTPPEQKRTKKELVDIVLGVSEEYDKYARYKDKPTQYEKRMDKLLEFSKKQQLNAPLSNVPLVASKGRKRMTSKELKQHLQSRKVVPKQTPYNLKQTIFDILKS